MNTTLGRKERNVWSVPREDNYFNNIFAGVQLLSLGIMGEYVVLKQRNVIYEQKRNYRKKPEL